MGKTNPSGGLKSELCQRRIHSFGGQRDLGAGLVRTVTQGGLNSRVGGAGGTPRRPPVPRTYAPGKYAGSELWHHVRVVGSEGAQIKIQYRHERELRMESLWRPVCSQSARIWFAVSNFNQVESSTMDSDGL